MATAWRIEQADRSWDSRPTGERFRDDVLLTVYVAPVDVDEVERRQAALWVADFFAASHGCNRTKRRRCTKPEHARDVAAAREWLAALALVEEEPETPAAVETAEPAPLPPRPRIDWEWQERAACRDEDLALFFPAAGERLPDREIREAEAGAVCSWCEVRAECLDYALARPEKDGTWGGLNEDERASERRRRMRRAANATDLEAAS